MRFIPELDPAIAKQCVADIDHPVGFKHASACLRCTTLVEKVACPMDVFAAYWLPWELSTNRSRYIKPLPDGCPTDSVLLVELDTDALLQGLSSAWGAIGAGCSANVHRKWYRRSVASCCDGPGLICWWLECHVQCAGAKHPEVACQALSTKLHQLAAQEPEGNKSVLPWVAGFLAQRACTIMPKVTHRWRLDEHVDAQTLWTHTVTECLRAHSRIGTKQRQLQ